MPKFLVLSALILSSICSVSSGQAEPSHFLLIDKTTSPDGKYALAWGMSDFSPLDPSKPEAIQENLDPDSVENYVVELETGAIMATLSTTYFAAGDFEKNHGSLSALWRDDSKALVIVEDGKWESQVVAVTYVVDPDHEFDRFSDVIPLVGTMNRQIRAGILKQNPTKAEAIEMFGISVSPKQWMAADTLQFGVSAFIPKDSEEFGFEGEFQMKLPGPNIAVIGGLVAKPGADGPPPLPGSDTGSVPKLPEADWYVGVDGKRSGPFASDALLARIRSGEVTGKSLVWKAGYEGWKSAGTIPELATFLGGGPALVPKIVIEGGSYKGITRGTTVVKLTETFPGRVRAAIMKTGEGDFNYFGLNDADGKEIVQFFPSDEGTIISAEVVSPALRAENGIGVGSTYADLRKAYPDLKVNGSEIEGYTTASSAATKLSFHLDVRFWSYELSAKELASIKPEAKVLKVHLF